MQGLCVCVCLNVPQENAYQNMQTCSHDPTLLVCEALQLDRKQDRRKMQLVSREMQQNETNRFSHAYFPEESGMKERLGIAGLPLKPVSH